MSTLPHDELGRAGRQALLIGAAGLVVAIIVGTFKPAPFFFGYLTSFQFWSGVPLGAAMILAMHHLTGGRWGWSIRGELETVLITIPLLLLLFIPIAAGAGWLYDWVTNPPELPEAGPAFRRWYLELPFFLLRAAICLVLWAAGGSLLAWWSRAQRSAAATPGLARFSAAGLVIYFLTVSFASIDWIASLEPRWFSSIFGLYIICGQALSAMAVIVLLLIGVSRWLGRPELLPANALNDLGNLLLTFVVLHAYMAFSQFLIIWNGNLADETPWYVPRMQGGWGWISGAIMLFHFALPFVALLFRAVKRDPRRLAAVALLILAARVLEAPWMVLPALHQAQWLGIVLSVPAWIGLGGLWLAVLLWFAARHPGAGVHEPLRGAHV